MAATDSKFPPQRQLAIRTSNNQNGSSDHFWTWVNFSFLIVTIVIICILGILGQTGRSDSESHVLSPAKTQPSRVSSSPVITSSQLSADKCLRISGWAESVDLVDSPAGEQVAFRRWQLTLQMMNESEELISVGQSIMLFEIDQSGEYDGVAVCYALDQASRPSLSFSQDAAFDSWGLTSHLILHKNDGSAYWRRGAFYFSQEATELELKGGGGFGLVRSGETASLSLIADQGYSVARNSLSLQVVLPDVRVATPIGESRYALIVTFNRTAAGSSRWTAGPQRVIPLKFEPLELMLNSSSSDTLSRVLAANLMTEVASKDTAARSLIKKALELRSGKLLSSLVQLLIHLDADDFTEGATTLLARDTTPEDIQGWAVFYLGRRKDPLGAQAIEKAVTSSRDSVAERALVAMSAVGGQRTTDILLLSLRDNKRPVLQSRAADLLSTLRPAAAKPEIKKQAEEGNILALQVLANFGSQEDFARFSKQLETEDRMDWRVTLIAGLWNSDQSRTIPKLLDLLTLESSKEGELRADVVTAAQILIKHCPVTEIPRLVELVRLGHRPASEILSEILASPGSEVALAALAAIEQEPDTVFLPYIEFLMLDEDEKVREAAERALRLLAVRR